MAWRHLRVDLGERAAPDQKEKKHHERQNPIEYSHVLLPVYLRLPSGIEQACGSGPTHLREILWFLTFSHKADLSCGPTPSSRLVSTDAGGLRLRVMRENPALKTR